MELNEQEMNSEDSENQENTDPTKTDSFLRSYFSKSYRADRLTPEEREARFYYWYNNGRPTRLKFLAMLKENFPTPFVPTLNTVDEWITEYRHRAAELDAQVNEQIEAAVISEKIEMLKRHAVTGVKMQDIALEFIDAHKDDLSMPAAVRLLVEGVRIERESRGIPEAIEKMTKMTDDQLLSEVKQLMTSSSVTLEELDANS